MSASDPSGSAASASARPRLRGQGPSRELLEWLALRRVHEGGVAKTAGIYVDHGRPVPGHLTEVFDRLTWTGLVTVADGDPLWELRSLCLTDAGQARYVALCQQRQRVTLPVPPAQFGTLTTQTSATRRSSVAPPPLSEDR